MIGEPQTARLFVSEQEIATTVRAHQYKTHSGSLTIPTLFQCKAGCEIEMLPGELASECEARHQASAIASLFEGRAECSTTPKNTQ